MTLANHISLIRIYLIPVFILCIFYQHLKGGLIIFLIACLTDGIDGYIARVYHQKSKLGAILDPLADKMLLIVAFVCLSIGPNFEGIVRIPPYVVIIILSRDAILLIGYVLIHLLRGNIEVRPIWAGKCTTVAQMLTIIAVLMQFPHINIIWNITLILTIYSGIRYLYKGIKTLNECIQ